MAHRESPKSWACNKDPLPATYQWPRQFGLGIISDSLDRAETSGLDREDHPVWTGHRKRPE